MHILILLTDMFDSVGGIQTFNKSIVTALNLISKEKSWKIKTLILNDNISRSDYSEAFKRNIFAFITSSFLNSLKAEKLILGHVNFAPVIPLIKLVNPKIKIYLIVYGIDVFKKLSFLQYLGVRQVNRIISISKSTREQMLFYNNLDKEKFEILPCTLDPEFGKDIELKTREELKLPKRKMILTVSRLDVPEREKNIDMVIKALPDTLKKIPDAFYVIIGDGPDKERLMKITDELGLTEKVIFVGQVNNELLPSYYKECDVFVLPSTKEGFGIVFLEAMYYGKPVIGANAGGIKEVIEDGKTGLLIEKDDKVGLVSSIINILSDEKLCKDMGDAGKKKLKQNFSSEMFKERLEDILCN